MKEIDKKLNQWIYNSNTILVNDNNATKLVWNVEMGGANGTKLS